MTELQPLTANSPEVIRELAKHGVKAGKNGDAPVPAGSKQKLPKAKPQPEEVKGKRLMVDLDAAELARLEREAANRKLTPKNYLQEIVSEHLKTDIGRAYITAPSNMGGRVTAPTNTFGRELKN